MNPLFSTNQWTASNFYGYGGRSAIQDIYSALEGGPGLANPASEFVYLEKELNGLKGVFFGRKTPNLQSDYIKTLAIVQRVSLVATYLQNENVAAIYRAVSARVRARFVYLQSAAHSTAAQPSFRKFDVDFGTIYDTWEDAYLTKIQNNMLGSITGGLGQAQAQMRAQASTGVTSITLARQLIDLAAQIEAEKLARFSTVDISLDPLRKQ